jgi:putative phage-type endonuclease
MVGIFILRHQGVDSMREPIKQGPDLDLELRQSYLGTSEWAVIAGFFTKYKSPYDVWNEKVNGYEPFDNIRMKLGRDIEPMIAKWVEEETGCKVAVDGYVRFHPKYDFLATNLDGVCHNEDGIETILEIKTASTIARESWGAELPIQYYTQIQGQMAITGLKQAHVAILTFGYAGPESFEIQTYDYDEEFANMVINKCISFWLDHVVTQVPPKPVTENDIKQAYPQANGHSLEASLELASKIETLKELKATKKEMDQSIKEMEIDIKKTMEDAESITFGENTLATWRNTKPRTSFNQKQFKEDHPDLYEKYLKEGNPVRTLRLK